MINLGLTVNYWMQGGGSGRLPDYEQTTETNVTRCAWPNQNAAARTDVEEGNQGNAGGSTD